MTYPAVDDLPEAASCTLLGICTQLSQSRHPGLARWATSVADALLVRVVSVTTGVHIDSTTTRPRQPVANLDAAELEGLYALLLAGAEASDDQAVARWCTRMSRLVVAEACRRELIQLAVDAKVAVIEAEERQRGCEVRCAPDVHVVAPRALR